MGSAGRAGAHPACAMTFGSASRWILRALMSGSMLCTFLRHGQCHVVCMKVLIPWPHMKHGSLSEVLLCEGRP